MTAIFLRELHSYFISPVGYVYLAAFYALAGYRYAVLILGGQADMSAEFAFLFSMILLLTPILTMRLISEERKQKTEQLLFSAPITLGGIVAGKYLAAVAVYVAGIAVTVFQALLLAPHAEFNWMIFWGNFLGILLTGMASIALCMFISAQTENQIIAAIGGLASMVMVLSLNSLAGLITFEPVQNALYSVSFYTRYHNVTMGIFKLSDLFFFVSFAAVFFLLTTRSLKKRKGALATSITILSIALIVVMNITVGRLSDRFDLSVDLTADKRYAISEDTIRYLENLDETVKITVLVDEESMASGSYYIVQAYQNLLQYQRNSQHIDLQFVDLIDNPTLASKYEGLNLHSYDIVVEQGERIEILSFAELYGYNQSGSQIVSSKVEQMVTNAIVSVTSKDKTVVSVLTGYGTVKPVELVELLESNRYETRESSLLTDKIDPDASAAILFAPQSDLEETSLNKLEKWLDHDGRQGKSLYIFLDPSIPNMPNFEAFLEEWGISLGEGYVFESNGSLYYDKIYYPVAQYADLEYASGMTSSDLTIMALCRPLDLLFEEKENYKTSVLLNFSPASGSAKPGQTSIHQEDVTGNVKGMVMSSHSLYGAEVTSSHIVVSGSALAFSGSLVSGSTFANADYILGVFKKLTGNSDHLSLVPKDLSVPTHTITRAGASAYTWFFMIILPLLALAGAAAVWLYRRHR